jgi:hypothetical protein
MKTTKGGPIQGRHVIRIMREYGTRCQFAGSSGKFCSSQLLELFWPTRPALPTYSVAGICSRSCACCRVRFARRQTCNFFENRVFLQLFPLGRSCAYRNRTAIPRSEFDHLGANCHPVISGWRDISIRMEILCSSTIVDNVVVYMQHKRIIRKYTIIPCCSHKSDALC